MLTKIKNFILSYKGRAIVNGLTSVLFMVAGYRVMLAHGDAVIAGMMLFNSMFFAFISGSHFSDHFAEKIRLMNSSYMDRQSDLIREMAAEVIRLRNNERAAS